MSAALQVALSAPGCVASAAATPAADAVTERWKAQARVEGLR
jgi:hypothetical protein